MVSIKLLVRSHLKDSSAYVDKRTEAQSKGSVQYANQGVRAI